ncbi:MAK10-like protein [Tanacetum coccineum]
MKYLVENKPRTEEDNEIRMNPRKLEFKNALPDLGASISIMPFSMYKRLGIGKLKLINMLIEMADNTKYAPKGIVENLLIKIDKFFFPVDFVILDMVEDIRIPIILGRPLLATAYAKS